MKIESKILNDYVVIDDISENSDDWKTIKSESFRPNRETYILEKFQKEFPSQKVSDYNLLTKLASRNKTLTEWLANVSLFYSKDVEVPRYLTEVIKPDEYVILEKEIVKYNQQLSSESKELEKASQNYKETIKDISKKYKIEKDKITENKVIKILTLNQTDLPLTLALQIENFTPATIDDAPTRRAYAREVLINFQLTLIKIVQEKPSINIDELLSELNGK
jgi:hypothetical protein